ncbi:hypothetical protein C5167_012770 [Papaver somniferum]|uniref:Uncharacterized protein n=1 Tax=Papaver somniferum TaxID=3469 RepID=A0A4Y7J1L5_PAPSO|nr:cytochrome P450 84A1-like [Papaver somniferum]RZC53922.1 hypothetical protein C5167_012770 [Papaver somniferum]
MVLDLQWLLYFTILPVLIFSMTILLTARKKLPYPPGPKGLPLLGNMFMMDQLTHRGLAKLSKQHGKNGLMYLRIGFLHMVSISTPEMARQVLQVQDSIFSNRPANIAIKYLTYDRADMAFAHYGPFWRQMRKICVVNLFSRKRAESWVSVRDEVESMVRFIDSKVGSPVNIGELVFNLMKNIIFRAAFGTASNEGQDEFVSIMQEFSKLFGAFNLADFFPGLGWIDPQGLNKRLVKARLSLDRFIDSIIDDHENKMMQKRNGNGDGTLGVEADMVDELLAANKNETSINLTRDNIKAIIMDVMFGGTETVASAIEWTMAELMKSPQDLSKVQQELDEVVGVDKRLQERDLENLTYLKFVVRETLRLHPPIPLLLHETSEDTEVDGYRIPRGSRVMINVWAVGRDQNSWEDAETYKPSRFCKEGAADFKGNNFEFLSFGSGRRSCPGMQLGLYALESSVAHLIHCFSWELPNGMKPSEMDMMDVFGLTAPRVVRLVAVPSRRLSCPLL